MRHLLIGMTLVVILSEASVVWSSRTRDGAQVDRLIVTGERQSLTVW